MNHRVGDGGTPHQNVIDGAGPLLPPDAETRRRVALGIDVDDEYALAHRSQCRPEIDRRRGLSHAAFLIGDGQDPRPRAGFRNCLRHERAFQVLRSGRLRH